MLSVAQQTDFTLLVDAFRQNYTTDVEIRKARLKAARQQSNIASFLCDMRTLARRAYRAFPHLVEQIVVINFIEGISDSSLRWELRKSKPSEQSSNDLMDQFVRTLTEKFSKAMSH